MASYALISIALLCASAPTLSSQVVKITGTVVDAAHGPIGGARVTIKRSADASERVTSTDGRFQLEATPGVYTVSVAKENFVDAVRSVDVQLTHNESLDFVLELAPVRLSVTVTDSARYLAPTLSSATKTLTPLRDIPQSITVIQQEQIRDQLLLSIGDAVRYIPGITAIQGENNRDQLVIRGTSTSADFFLNGVRDDVQYFRDLYNLERLEALKGPNALTFGRGGGGGVINRVTKEPQFSPLREINVTGGSFGTKRVSADLDQPINALLAFRMNAMYEDSSSFRDHVDLRRYGINPALTIALSKNTRVILNFENFRDARGADRGIPSFGPRPLDIGISTFFGNPDLSEVRARVNLGSALVEHQRGRLTLRNRVLVGDYNRAYSNFVPGIVTAERTQNSLSAYNNATQRRNVFNQTDAVYAFSTGAIRHTLLAGAEFGLQDTDNLRNTGFFNNKDSAVLVPLSNPTIATPVTFRPNATDANNHVRTRVGAGYVQDQVNLSRYFQLTAGLRFDEFDLQYLNNRNADRLRRTDYLLSPRAGLVFKPMQPLSIYTSYSVSYLPSSGDQFSSLTSITQQVKPEKFSNYEAGIKWDVRRSLAVTAAVFRQNRDNTRATDPADPTRIIQTGGQRTNGFEAGITGSITRAWRIAGGCSYLDAFVTRPTIAARAGAQVGQVPHHAFSIWNNYQFLPRLAGGIGVLNRADMFAAIDNTVVLPGYARVDAAVFYTVTEHARLQVNVENLLDRKYFLNADSNTNISPGSPRAIRAGITVRF